MNGYESSSDRGSGTTSASGPPNPTSESELLRAQAEQAKAAMQVTLDRLKADLRHGADLRAWTREHPWVLTASAAVAGFLAASAMVPSKEEQALKRIAELERATASYPPPEADNHSARAPKPPSRSFWSSLASEVLEAVKPALLSALSAGVAAKAAKPSQEEMKAAAAKEVQEQTAPGPWPPRV